MGLFGGFKAKLRANRRQPQRKDNIVCVKFNSISSEFDASPSTLPSCSNTNPGRNEVIKEKRRPTKPEIKGIFPINGEASPVKNEPSPPPKQQAPQPSQVIRGAKPPPQPPQRTVEDTKPHFTSNRSTSDHEVKKHAPKIPTPLAARKEFVKEEEAPLSSDEDDDDNDDDGNFKIQFTANRSAIKPQAPEAPKVEENNKESSSTDDNDDDGNFKIEFAANRSAIKPEASKVEENNKESSSSDDEDVDEGNFKIHFVQNTDQHNGNLSDENSEDDDDEQDEDNDNIDFSPIKYSSQASSIFFGEEEEPIIMRPRNVTINDDDGDNDSHGSSASA